MKKIYLTLCLLSLSLYVGAQCTATALYPSLSVTPTPAWTDISSCNFAGEYALVNVTAGNLYEFSTCAANGSTITFDSELTLRSNTGLYLAYSDDYCGTQSYVSWTATYTGQVQIHLHLYPCASNLICSNIRMKVTSAAPAPANNDCANATILAVNTSCLLTSGTTSGATEDPILDPSCDPGSINDVWYTFNSGANTSVNVTVNLGTASLVGIEMFSACGTLAPGISLGGALGNCDFNTNAPNPTVVTGLTPNTVYRFRLFTNITYDIAGSFTVCLTVPPPPPAPTVSINSASICPGASTTLTATPSTLGGTYLWSPGGQTTQSITVSPLTTTTYSVTYTLNGVGTNNSTVTVYSPPAINAGLDISICSGQPATLTGSGGVSYTWNNGVTNNLPFNPLTTATYTVTGTDLNGCIGTDQMTLTVNANPTLSGNTVICPSTTSQLLGSGTAAANNAWTSSNPAVATVSTTGLVSALSFGTAIITYTNNNSCSATSTINVSNPTAPTFNPVAAVCSGGAIVLPIISSNGIQGTWSPAINNTQTTTYTFTPSVGQCATTAQLSVPVNPNPSISGGTAVCSGGTLQLTGSGTAAANNAWSSASTAIAGISGTGLVTGTSAGTSVVTYTNSNGCLATASVTVNANPTANAGLDITTCVGGNVTLSGTATNGAAPYTYSWNNSVQNGVPFVALTNSTYTLSVSDGNGCTNTDQMTLTTNSINWANLQFPASGNICLGQSHTIYGQIYVAGVTNGPGQAAGVVAQAGLNASNTDPSTWPLSAWSAATFNVQQGNNDEYMASVGQLQAAGTYYYTYRYSLGAGCPYFYAGINGAWNGTSNTNGSLVINNAPNATINQSACASYSWYGQNYTQSGTYTQTVPSGAGCDSVLYLNLTIHQPVTGPSTQQTACETYTWNGQTYTQSGSYTFNGTTQYGCDSTVTLNLVIDASPSNLNVTLSGGTFTATASNVGNYSWIDCATNTSIPFQNAATFTPTSSGSYAVVVSNNCGADTSTCEPIEVNGLSDAVLPIINVYPNPSSGIFNVFSEMEITFLEILDLKGAVVYNSKPNDNLATIDLRFQADGIYVLKLRTPQNTSYFRIVKN